MTSDAPKKPKRGRVKKGIYVLPSLLTLASLFCGFYAIVATLNGRYIHAAVAILVSAFFDGMDGKVARLTRATSRFGEEFDSLSDLVAFGVAPGLLAFSWALRPYGRLGWLAAFLYVACGALRLARFNVQMNTVEYRYFRGLPIPAAACLVAATVLFTRHFICLLLIFLLAFLMVSNMRYQSFKDLVLLKRKPFGTLVAMILAIVVVMAEPEIVILIFASSYLLLGPINTILGWYKKRVATPAAKEETSLLRSRR